MSVGFFDKVSFVVSLPADEGKLHL